MATPEGYPEQAGRKAQVTQVVEAPRERVFDALTRSEDLTHWHHAGEGWTTPFAETDLRPGGKLRIGYRSPDGKDDFTLEGTYREVKRPERISYDLEDGRPVVTTLEDVGGRTKVTTEFALETEYPEGMQRAGWTEHLQNLASYLSR